MGCCQSVQHPNYTPLGNTRNDNEVVMEGEYIRDVIVFSVKETTLPQNKESTYKEESNEQTGKVESLPAVQLPQEEQPQTVSNQTQQSAPQPVQPSQPQWALNHENFVKINEQKNVNDIYQVKEVLGQGGFGKVYRVIHKQTNMVRAMKTIAIDKMSADEIEKLQMECSILKEIDHPNVVKLFEVFRDDSFYYLISEFCDGKLNVYLIGGELFDKIRVVDQLSETLVASYIKQVISAIMYCHKRGIVHRDLKPENILFDSKKSGSTIKVIDFGASAKMSKDQKLSKRIGTPFYVAPEVLAARYDEKCDIWSLGVILYTLLCGYPPFFANSEVEVLKKVKQGTYTFDTNDWAKVSIQAKDLIRRMLMYEPSQRISATDAYNHPWIQNNRVKGTIQNQALAKLSDFHVKNKLKMAILEFISVQVMTSQEKNDLLAEFRDLDKNGDGMVSKNELFQGLLKIKSSLPVKAQHVVDEIFAVIDANGSGLVDFTEFIAAAVNRQQRLSKLRIEQSFKLFDLDGNGLITREEVKELFGGVELDDEMWREILAECDTNKDGKISQQEFVELLQIKGQKE